LENKVVSCCATSAFRRQAEFIAAIEGGVGRSRLRPFVLLSTRRVFQAHNASSILAGIAGPAFDGAAVGVSTCGDLRVVMLP
jgi:hypothetical protein